MLSSVLILCSFRIISAFHLFQHKPWLQLQISWYVYSLLFFLFKLYILNFLLFHLVFFILGCLEISSTKDIVPLLLILPSGKFSWQGQKSATFFIKVSQEWSIAQVLILFPSEISWMGPVESVYLSGFQDSTRMAN